MAFEDDQHTLPAGFRVVDPNDRPLPEGFRVITDGLDASERGQSVEQVAEGRRQRGEFRPDPDTAEAERRRQAENRRRQQLGPEGVEREERARERRFAERQRATNFAQRPGETWGQYMERVSRSERSANSMELYESVTPSAQATIVHSYTNRREQNPRDYPRLYRDGQRLSRNEIDERIASAGQTIEGMSPDEAFRYLFGPDPDATYIQIENPRSDPRPEGFYAAPDEWRNELDRRQIEDIRRERRRAGRYEGVGGFFKGVQENLSGAVEVMLGGTTESVGDILGSDYVSRLGERLGRSGRVRQEIADPHYEGSVPYYLYHGTNALAELSSAAVVGAVGRDPRTATSIIMGMRVFGQRYRESQADGRSVGQSLVDGLVYATAEAVPERIVLGRIMRPGGRFGQNLAQRIVRGTATGALAESAQEMFTEAIQMGYDYHVLNENMTWGEAWRRMRDAGIIGAIGGGPVGGAFSARDSSPETQALRQIRDGEWELPADMVAVEELRPRTEGELRPGDRESPIPNDVLAEGNRTVEKLDEEIPEEVREVLPRRPRPRATTPPPRVRDSGHRVATDIVDFLVSNGIREEVAHGIAAGVAAESNNNHGIRNQTSGAFGLGQWLGSRQQELFRRYGPNPTRQQQLQFLLHELRGGDHGGRSVLRSRNADEALNNYITRFMRPAAGAETTGDLARGRAALQALGRGYTAHEPVSVAEAEERRPAEPFDPLADTRSLLGEAFDIRTASEGQTVTFDPGNGIERPAVVEEAFEVDGVPGVRLRFENGSEREVLAAELERGEVSIQAVQQPVETAESEIGQELSRQAEAEQARSEAIISPAQQAQVEDYARQFLEGGDRTAAAVPEGAQPSLGAYADEADGGFDLGELDQDVFDDYGIGAEADRQALDQEITEYYKRFYKALEGLNVRPELSVVGRIVPQPGASLDEDFIVQGWHHNGLIQIALQTPNDPISTLDHEVMHYLRWLGSFTKTEWNMLAARASRDQSLQEWFEDGYGDSGLSEAQKTEELIAEMFSRWRAEKGDVLDPQGRPVEPPKTFIDRVFTKLSQIIYALRKAFGAKPNEMREALAIMEKISSGEIGARTLGRESVRRFGVDQEFTREEMEEFADKEFGRASVTAPANAMFSLSRPSAFSFPNADVEAAYLEGAPRPPRPPKMTARDYDLFTRKTVIDDAQMKAMLGEELPYGFTEETLASAERKINEAVAKNKVVLDAVRRRRLAEVLAAQAAEVDPADILDVVPPQPDEDGTTRAGNINLDRLESVSEIDAALAGVNDQFGGFRAARRGVQSWEDTKRLADEMGMSTEDLLKHRNGEAFSAEQAYAARQLLIASANNLVQLAQAAREDNSDKNLFALQKAWIRHVAIQERIAAITAEAGRTLNQFKMTARTGGDLNARMLKEIMNLEGGRGDLQYIADLIVGNHDNPAILNRLSREAYDPNRRDKLFELWINGLLSWFPTHSVNMISNTLTQLTQPAEFEIAAGLGKIRSLFGGNTKDRVIQREVAARLFGLVQGSKEGALAFATAMRTGEPTDALSKLEVRRQRAISGTKGEIVRIPGRLLMASDELFKAIARRADLNGMAVRRAMQEGLTEEAFEARVAELTAHPTDEMIDEAIGYSRYATFTKPLGEKGQRFTNLVNSIPGARIFITFIRTPTNLFKYAIERSPAAPVLKEVRDDLRAGGARRDLAVARIIFGAGISLLVVALAQAGIITGGEPPEEADREVWRATGRQPYSIKVGDTYVSYARLDPLATIMGITADLVQADEYLSEDDSRTAVGAIAMAVLNQIKNKTFLEGIGNIIQVVEDPDRYGENLASSTIGSAVPALVAGITRTTDPVVRDARNVVDRVRSRIPGMSNNLYPRRDIWGQPVMREGAIGPDIASPFLATTDRNDRVAEELLRVHASIRRPERSPNGEELDPALYDRYQELAGRYLREDLEELVGSAGWASLTPEEAREEVDLVKNDARRAAREELGIGEEE